MKRLTRNAIRELQPLNELTVYCSPGTEFASAYSTCYQMKKELTDRELKVESDMVNSKITIKRIN